MNSVCVSGRLLNVPRYDVIPSTSDSILRFLLDVDGTVLPVVCCNEMANLARKSLLGLSVQKGQEIFVAGSMKGNSYTDAVGSKNYLVYLVVSCLAYSHSELLMREEIETTLVYSGLPFDVADMEDILRYMES